jgi:hypothetical protein
LESELWYVFPISGRSIYASATKEENYEYEKDSAMLCFVLDVKNGEK